MAQLGGSQQCSRWTFTINNYDVRTNYKEVFTDENIKRAVWGFEVASQTGIPHIQGYLEFKRTYRLSRCRALHPTAHWEVAREDSYINYNYCVKGGDFEVVGNWPESEGRLPNAEVVVRDGVRGRRPPSVPMVVAALLDPRTKLQTKVSTEYSLKHNYYDKVNSLLSRVRINHEVFSKWNKYKLYPWQYEVRIYI